MGSNMNFSKTIVRVASLMIRQQRAQSVQSSTADKPVIKGEIAKRIPALVKLKPGKQYHWCACGLSKKGALCDGTHKTMPEPRIGPIVFEVATEKKYLLCRCKQTNNRPFCDLSHVKTFVPQNLRKLIGIKL